MAISPLQQVIYLIEKSKKILVLPSMPVDGDSLGGAIALYLALKKLNKEITVVCTDPVTNAFKFLPHSQEITQKFSAVQDFIVTLDCENAEVDHVRYNVEKDKVNIIITPKKGRFAEKNVNFHYGQAKYDLIIVVDAGDLEQLGKLYEDNVDLFYSIPVLNIDHHPSNSGFGKVNLVDITASSTTEILYELIKELRPQNNLIDEDIATALLTGIITDTGSFQNSNTTPKALEISAELVNLGARQQEIIQNIYKTKQLSTLKLWGRILSKITYDSKYHLVWSTISHKDLEETQSTPDATGGIIDELMTNAPGAEIIVLLKEKQKGLLTGSIRTTNHFINASEIAALFGGGGHTRAAGFRVKYEDFDRTVQEIISDIKDYQAKRLNLHEEEEISKAMPVKKPKTPIDQKQEEVSTEKSAEEAQPSPPSAEETFVQPEIAEEKKETEKVVLNPPADEKKSTDEEVKKEDTSAKPAEGDKPKEEKPSEENETSEVSKAAKSPQESEAPEVSKEAKLPEEEKKISELSKEKTPPEEKKAGVNDLLREAMDRGEQPKEDTGYKFGE